MQPCPKRFSALPREEFGACAARDQWQGMSRQSSCNARKCACLMPYHASSPPKKSRFTPSVARIALIRTASVNELLSMGNPICRQASRKVSAEAGSVVTEASPMSICNSKIASAETICCPRMPPSRLRKRSRREPSAHPFVLKPESQHIHDVFSRFPRGLRTFLVIIAEEQIVQLPPLFQFRLRQPSLCDTGILIENLHSQIVPAIQQCHLGSRARTGERVKD